MAIAAFVIMVLITLAGLAYPLLGATSAPVGPKREARATAAGACVSCGRALADDELFCPRCGTPAGRRCAACGRSLDADDVYCPGCGAKAGEG